jgi:acetyltransferase-like isoleucine patch superfamily enzyme
MQSSASFAKQVLKRIIPTSLQLMILGNLPKKRTVGRDSYIHPSVQILGVAHVVIGDNTCISEDTWLNVNQRAKGHVAISIGSNCFIGRRNFFSSGAEIRIGNYVLTTVDCKFIGSSHVVDDPLVPYLASGTTTHGRICVGANCFFGVGSMVLGSVTIGHGSVIGAGALVADDVPPFSMVVGNPARQLRRYSFPRKSWVDIGSFSEEDAASIPDEAAYVALLEERHPKIHLPLIAAGSSHGDL